MPNRPIRSREARDCHTVQCIVATVGVLRMMHAKKLAFAEYSGTIFDVDLLAIEPYDLTIELHPKLAQDD